MILWIQQILVIDNKMILILDILENLGILYDLVVYQICLTKLNILN